MYTCQIKNQCVNDRRKILCVAKTSFCSRINGAKRMRSLSRILNRSQRSSNSISSKERPIKSSWMALPTHFGYTVHMHKSQISPEGDPKRGSGSLGLLCTCLVGIAFSANYTNHAPLIPSMMEDFGFSLAMAGFLTTGIFLTHAGMQIPCGYLADWLGARRVIAIALAQVCIGNFAIAFASAYWQLFFWKVFVGLGTGACFVAGAGYISAAFPEPNKAHLAQGYYGGSILLGSGFVIFAVPRVAATFGWRGGFLATAAMAAAAWIVWTSAAPSPTPQQHMPVSFIGMIADLRLWRLGLMQMASFGLVIVVSSWIAAFLQRSLLLDIVTASMLGSVALLLGIIMRPLGGVLVRRIHVRPMLCLSLSLSAAGCFALAFDGGSVALTVLAIIMIGAGCGLPYSALFTRAAELFPSRAGAAMGLVNMLGIVMILIAPPLIGRLVEWSGSFQSSFLALGVFSVAAFAGTLGIHKP
jgi:MFS family permease